MSWATVRDVLALDPNPAKVTAREIAKRFGIGEHASQRLRAIACQSPEAERQRLAEKLGVERGRAPL